jgi:hypothetical protein
MEIGGTRFYGVRRCDRYQVDYYSWIHCCCVRCNMALEEDRFHRLATDPYLNAAFVVVDGLID